jgi:hypothetical protein
MSDSAGTIGYATAADAYWQAGWRGVLPMCRGFKGGRQAMLPVGYTGHQGVDPSYADILEWSANPVYADGNLCLRMPDGVVGIDVDAYGAKTGGRALAEAISRWGPLPAGPRSTSRRDTDPVSGIRLFRIPPGTLLQDRITFPELGVGDIELCQRHHRYVVAWPSIHPEGRDYWWTNDDMQLIGIPAIDELPWLPQTWIDALRVTPRSLNLNGEHYDVRATLTAGEPSIAVTSRLSQAIKELNLPGQSRHDTCCRHVMALMRMGKNGDPGVHQALGVLREVLVAARRTDNSNTPDGTRDEFDRMITNDNAARELVTPSPLDWMKTLGADTPTNGSTPSGGVEGVDYRDVPAVGVDTDASRPRSHLEEIEQGFWERREALNIIYTASLARMCAPWAVLAFCAARVLTQVRPMWTLPALIGGDGGSLNWFAAIAAASSGGKTTSANLARKLIKGDVRERKLGSGEGIIGQYLKPAMKKGELDEFHEANMFVADEVDSVHELSSRSGQTTMSVLREAFSGSTLGFSYISKGRDVHLKAHSYRMTLVIAVQPARSGTLFDGHHGGTPQRFMWFPANDTRISREAYNLWIPGPIELPQMDSYPHSIAIPKVAVDAILDHNVRNAHGEVGELDGHILFSREKFAYALALLDGRLSMSEEDWELSGTAAEVSARTREWIMAGLGKARESDAIDRGMLRGVEQSAAESERDFQKTQKVQRLLRWILDKLDEAGPEGIPNRELAQKANSRDRHLLNSALQIGTGNGLIRLVEGTTTWVKL